MSVNTLLMADQLRRRFQEKYRDEIAGGQYDSRDLQRVERCDRWLEYFISWNNNDVTKALNNLVAALKWRKDFGTNDITEDMIPEWVLQSAGYYTRYKAKDGTSCWWVHTKAGDPSRGAKNLHHLKRFYVWSMECGFRCDPAIQHTCVVDFTNGHHFPNWAVLELGKFVLTVSGTYYPAITKRSLLVGMPRLFSGFLRAMLLVAAPQERKTIEFISKDEIHNYIDWEFLPPSMGGSNKTIGRHIPWEQVKDVTVDEDNKTNLIQ